MVNLNLYRLELGVNRHPALVLENVLEYDVKPVGSPQTVVSIINSVFQLNCLTEENVVMLALDSKGQILGLFRVSQGTINSSFCNAREVFLRALLAGAYGIIVLHNHPSGFCEPSKNDYEVAKKLEQAGRIVGIELMDFIIIGDTNYYSFKENDFI